MPLEAPPPELSPPGTAQPTVVWPNSQNWPAERKWFSLASARIFTTSALIAGRAELYWRDWTFSFLKKIQVVALRPPIVHRTPSSISAWQQRLMSTMVIPPLQIKGASVSVDHHQNRECACADLSASGGGGCDFRFETTGTLPDVSAGAWAPGWSSWAGRRRNCGRRPAAEKRKEGSFTGASLPLSPPLPIDGQTSREAVGGFGGWHGGPSGSVALPAAARECAEELLSGRRPPPPPPPSENHSLVNGDSFSQTTKT